MWRSRNRQGSRARSSSDGLGSGRGPSARTELELKVATMAGSYQRPDRPTIERRRRQAPLGALARLLGAAGLAFAASLAGPSVPVATAAEGVLCEHLDHDGARYAVCTVDLSADLRLFLADGEGVPYGSFRTLADDLAARGERLLFAANAGMYDDDQFPVGLYVEGGRRLKAANTRDGYGNFHMKPNGIFFWSGATGGVMETSRFLREKPEAAFATQSGPMLVIGGRLHPRFLADSTSRKIRNGVGMRDARTAVFALSEQPVTFHAFATLFRDRLGCADALFLDGTISSFYAPDIGLRGSGYPLGPIVALVGRD